MSKQSRILVTGGCGYIGSHTIIELVQQGYEVLSVDNLSRANADMLDAIERVTGHRIDNHMIDLSYHNQTMEFFENVGKLDGIIHFAAYKSVAESVLHPAMYYKNNILSTLNVLEGARITQCKAFVFSSSCSVYGNVAQLPVTEDTPIGQPESPYAYTKVAGEGMVKQFVSQDGQMKATLLRYFNPAGAHESGKIGEVSFGKAIYLVPVIMETALGKRSNLTVYGSDYNTRDGTCIRDFIHIQDLATAHINALEYMLKGKQNVSCSLFNLGSGTGTTVLEAIQAFEAVSGQKLPVIMADRRPGDVEAIYADYTKAKKLLGWSPKRTIQDIMRSAWEWEKRG